MDDDELIPPPPLPDGYVWVTFVGGSLEGEVRIAKLPIDEGDRYTRIATGEVWDWRDGRFRYLGVPGVDL